MHKVGTINVECKILGVSFGPSSIAAAAGEGDRMYYRMIELLRVLLPKLLEKVFGQLSVRRGPDGAAYYKFDRLNLDLGRVRLSDLEETLKSRLADKISAELARALPARTDETGRFMQMLEDYLSTGSAPWNGSDLDLRHWESRLPGLLARLGQQGALGRSIQTCQTGQTGQAVMSSANGAQTPRGEDAARLLALLADPLKARRLRALLAGLGLGDLIPRELRLDAATPGRAGFSGRPEFAGSGGPEGGDSAATPTDTGVPASGFSESAPAGAVQAESRLSAHNAPAGADAKSSPYAAVLESNGRAPGQDFGKTFVNNAGLVLLAPFLPHYFRRLGLLDERGDFKSQLQRAQAVVALQAALGAQNATEREDGNETAATAAPVGTGRLDGPKGAEGHGEAAGHSEPDGTDALAGRNKGAGGPDAAARRAEGSIGPDFAAAVTGADGEAAQAAWTCKYHEGELILNKLLCSWPLSWPLDLPEPYNLPPEEPQALLDAVIWQWNALRGMERSAFAGAFLRRGATLLFDGHHRLHVEHQPQDVLLAHLPWALSIISTPWLAGPMEVIWD